MVLSIMVFTLMPYLDRSKIPGGARYRPWYRTMFFIFIADFIVLSYIGSQPPGGQLVTAGRWSTYLYFLLFAVLPLVSIREEKYLRKRGLPAEVEAVIHDEQLQKQDTSAK